MSLFHRTSLAFSPIDPLGDGLGDDIAIEQAEEQRFELEEQLDDKLVQQWDEILVDARKDPTFGSIDE